MKLIYRELGPCDYEATWQNMRDFTLCRTGETVDEIWSVQHAPVYTRGQRDHETSVARADIPVINIDRGGLMTYHGPGQAIVYVLVDLKRLGIGIRSLVTAIEDAVIEVSSSFGITATGRRDAPGVYVDGRKLASLGLRVRKARTYHGVALNVAMDLSPFDAIVPCGIADIEMTQLKSETSVDVASVPQIARQLAVVLAGRLDLELTSDGE